MKPSTTLPLLAMLLTSLTLTACNDDDDNDGDTGTAGASSDITLNFAAKVGDADFVCGTTYSDIGIGSNDAARTIKFVDYRVFVSNLRLKDSSGNELPVALTQDGVWQHENVALLDFEDNCKTTGGTTETNTSITGTVAEAEYAEVCFDIGVPFGLNHLDNATAASPLNASGMFWSWAGGHKFIRIDGTVDPGDGEANLNAGYNLHLGSTGCVSDDKTTAPTENCAQPNVMEVCLTPADGVFDPTSDTINFDIAAVYKDTDLSADVDAPSGCMSFAGDNACREILPNLGLPYYYSDEDITPANEQVFVSIAGES